MDKLQPKAVIFDLGSTLIEYETVPWSEMNLYCVNSARDYLIKEGYDVPDEKKFHRVYEEVKDRYRKTAVETLVEWTVTQAAGDMLKGWNIKVNGDLLDRFFKAYYKPIGRKIFPYKDTLETLEKVKQRYPVIGMVSNTIFPERAHREELKRFGIEPYLNFAVFSSTFGLRKPHPDIFYKAANLAGYAPSECVFIGDRYLEDVQGPTAVGMHAILKLWNSREYPDNMPEDTRSISSLSELGSHLEFSC
jgi:putative hydrolase of the HAD superfamily